VPRCSGRFVCSEFNHHCSWYLHMYAWCDCM